MIIAISIGILVGAILFHMWTLASIVLLFLVMRICFDIMSERSKRQREEAEHNEVIRLSNREKRKAAAQKAASVSIDDLTRKPQRR